MDALKLLKDDHQKVAKIMEKIDETTERAAKTREELFTKMYDELTLHANMEEALFYPVMEEFKTSHDLVLEANEEHNLIKLLLEELKVIPYEDETWKAKFTVLKENVEHHVDEEENELFPKVRECLPKATLESIAEKMLEYKHSHLS